MDLGVPDFGSFLPKPLALPLSVMADNGSSRRKGKSQPGVMSAGVRRLVAMLLSHHA
jgi:hypothetical protein